MIRVAISTSSMRLNQALRAMLAERGRFEILTPGAPHALDSEIGDAADVLVTDGAANAESADAGAVAHGVREAALVLLSDEDDLPAGPRALRGGFALLSTTASEDQIIAAIEAAAAGLAVVHPDHVGSVSARPGDDPLTPREREVLQLLAGGLGNKEIAGRLAISDHTAKFHVSQILAKLNAASRAEAVSIAMRRGIVPL